jgi:hypothetical protein
MKWKIGVLLVLLILFLPMIANAEETTKVYSISDIIAFKKQGWKASTFIGFEVPTITIFQVDGIVGKNIMIEGGTSVTLTKNNQTLYEPISSYPFFIRVYKDDVAVDVLIVVTDDNGDFSVDFTPKEPGYYNIVWKSGYDWLPIENTPSLGGFPLYFYVSEKDTDNDGVPDKYDYDPYDPNIQSRGDAKAPAFEAIFAITGLLAVAYLLRRRR